MLTKQLPITRETKKLRKLYAGNRTVENFISVIERSKPPDNLSLFVGRLNSYLGFLRHYNSYGIRRRILAKMNKGWWEYIFISDHHRKVSIKKNV